jgi:hypothetical protein
LITELESRLLTTENGFHTQHLLPRAVDKITNDYVASIYEAYQADIDLSLEDSRREVVRWVLFRLAKFLLEALEQSVDKSLRFVMAQLVRHLATSLLESSNGKSMPAWYASYIEATQSLVILSIARGSRCCKIIIFVLLLLTV